MLGYRLPLRSCFELLAQFFQDGELGHSNYFGCLVWLFSMAGSIKPVQRKVCRIHTIRRLVSRCTKWDEWSHRNMGVEWEIKDWIRFSGWNLAECSWEPWGKKSRFWEKTYGVKTLSLWWLSLTDLSGLLIWLGRSRSFLMMTTERTWNSSKETQMGG